MNIGPNIKTRRLARGLTQDEFARRLGKSKSTICGWERGSHAPSLNETEEIARALGCTEQALLHIAPKRRKGKA